jgi:uncharacterized repeat protein (TIGR03943 family)
MTIARESTRADGAAVATEATHPRWSPARVASGLVLAAWGVLFWFLMASGRTQLYLSSRTSWLVPLGAILATATAAGRLGSARTTHPAPVTKREAWTMGLIVLPVVLLLTLPPVTLGSYAVGKRSAFSAGGVSGSASADAPVDMVSIALARATESGQAALLTHAGESVTLEGFATLPPGGAGDEIRLSRFVITCCVADAVISYVTVVNVPAGTVQDDQWLSVTGKLYPLGTDVVIDAGGSVTPIPQPEHPYLTA